MSEQVTIDHLLAEWDKIRETAGRDDKGYTTGEIAGALGWHRLKVNAMIQRLKEEGRLCVGWRTVERIDGRSTLVPVYRVKEEE